MGDSAWRHHPSAHLPIALSPHSRLPQGLSKIVPCVASAEAGAASLTDEPTARIRAAPRSEQERDTGANEKPECQSNAEQSGTIPIRGLAVRRSAGVQDRSAFRVTVGIQ